MKAFTKACFIIGVISSGAVTSQAVQYVLSIDGSDAIFLAGRTDLVPPPLDGNPNAFVTLRHGFITPEATVETLPPGVPVAGGDVVKISDPASGGINFYVGFGPPFFGPEGNDPTSIISSLDGISGYQGTQGALAGVFLDDSIPNSGPAPATLDFTSAAARDFASLSPMLGQVFFVGDGLNSALAFQEFIAPAGATRLFLGIPDAFGFVGVPGAYDDNDGSYRVTIGINEVPPALPDGGGTLMLCTIGMAGLLFSGAVLRKLSKA